MKNFSFRRLWLLVVVLVLAVVGKVGAQAPGWAWAVSPGTSDSYSTAIDAAGNVYVTGCFYDTITFGALTLTSVGSIDIFVAKLTSSGTVLWAVRAGGSGFSIPYSVAVDSSGSVYIAGYLSGRTAVFGPFTLRNRGTNIFVAKLTPAGAWQWATNTRGNLVDIAHSLTVDGSGSVVVTGQMTSTTAVFGTTTLTSVGGVNMFLAKLTPAGVWQWATLTNNAVGYGVDVDAAGTIYLTGLFSNTSSFGVTSLTSAGSTDVFVAKLTPGGAYQWAVRAGGSDDDFSRGVVVDGSGHVVVSGYFLSTTAAFGPTTLANGGNYDIFVTRLTSNGAFEWATRAGGTATDFASRVAVDGSGSILVTGGIGSAATIGATTFPALSPGGRSAYVAALTPAGAWQWATSVNSDSSIIEGTGVAVGANGNVVVTGVFYISATFGATTLTHNVGSAAGFVASLNAATGFPTDAPTLTTLAPNPAHHSATLTGATAPTATLFDGLGRVVRTAPVAAGRATLDVRGLPAGVYAVRAGGAARRLVVE